MNIPVPPTFVAYNARDNQCAALIEWFLCSTGIIKEESESGGDLCQQFLLILIALKVNSITFKLFHKILFIYSPCIEKRVPPNTWQDVYLG
jgi:hypothetical protein